LFGNLLAPRTKINRLRFQSDNEPREVSLRVRGNASQQADDVTPMVDDGQLRIDARKWL